MSKQDLNKILLKLCSNQVFAKFYSYVSKLGIN